MGLILILLGVIAFIVIATSKFKLHPFLTLILASFLTAFAYGLPSNEIAKTITGGFGGILGYIGLVIVLGTIIGTILEKSGAAITMADVVIKLFGQRFPTLTMSMIGYLVSIPVFCDSGFVILNSLKLIPLCRQPQVLLLRRGTLVLNHNLDSLLLSVCLLLPLPLLPVCCGPIVLPMSNLTAKAPMN